MEGAANHEEHGHDDESGGDECTLHSSPRAPSRMSAGRGGGSPQLAGGNEQRRAGIVGEAQLLEEGEARPADALVDRRQPAHLARGENPLDLARSLLGLAHRQFEAAGVELGLKRALGRGSEHGRSVRDAVLCQAAPGRRGGTDVAPAAPFAGGARGAGHTRGVEVSEARAWIADLPPTLSQQRRLIARLLEVCLSVATARVFLVGCSIGRGAADELSDVDCFIGCDPENVDEVLAAVRAALPEMGALVDELEHPYYGLTRVVAQFSGCVQLDLVVGPSPQGRAPDEIVLLDRDGVMETDRAVALDVVTPEVIREWSFLAWEGLADMLKYLRRGSTWEALDRLHSVRGRIWALWAAARGARYPAFGLSQVLDRDPSDLPDGIGTTVSDLDSRNLRLAALAAAAVLTRVSAAAAEVHGGVLPDALARHVEVLLRDPG